MNQTIEYELSFRGVALLYALSSNDLNVQVSDNEGAQRRKADQ